MQFAAQPLSLSWRYLVTAAPAAPLLLVAALRRLVEDGRVKLALGYGLALLAAIAASAGAYLLDPGVGMREVVAHLGGHHVAGEPVVASRLSPLRRAFNHYDARFGEPLVPEGVENDALAGWAWQQGSEAGAFWLVHYPSPGIARDRLRRAIEREGSGIVRDGEPFAYGECAIARYVLNRAPHEASP